MVKKSAKPQVIGCKNSNTVRPSRRLLLATNDALIMRSAKKVAENASFLQTRADFLARYATYATAIGQVLPFVGNSSRNGRAPQARLVWPKPPWRRPAERRAMAKTEVRSQKTAARILEPRNQLAGPETCAGAKPETILSTDNGPRTKINPS